MKAAEPKAAAAPAKKNNSPFFNKEGGQGFFGSDFSESSFFTNKSSGNRNSFIQPKLTIGQPDDVYEKEADAMADKVVQRLSENKVQTKPENNTFFFNKNRNGAIQQKPVAPPSSITPLVQTKCSACEQEDKLQKKEDVEEKDLLRDELQKKPIFEGNAEPPDDEKNVQLKCAGCEKEKSLQKKEKEEDNDLLKGSLQKKPIFEGNAKPPDNKKNIQRKCAECEHEDKLQKKSDSAPQTASPNIESSLSSSQGSGSPIPTSTREQMESSFGADFSGVRIHNNSSSVQMNEDLQAQAFTHGSDIYFNQGKFDTNTSAGKQLLAHELTHTIQQGGVEPSPNLKKKSIQKTPKKHGELVQDKLRGTNTTLITEAPIPGAAPRGLAGPGQSLGFDKMGYADLIVADSVSGIKGFGIDEITTGSDAGKKKYVYTNIRQSVLDKAKGPKTISPVLTGGTGEYARFIVDSNNNSKHYNGHNSMTGNFPSSIKIGEIKGKDTLKDNPLFAPEQLDLYRRGLNQFIATVKRDFGSHLVKPTFGELSGLVIPPGLKYDDFEKEHKKESDGIIKVESSKRIWLAEVGQTGIYLWARLPHPFNIPADVSKEEHMAIAKLKQDVLEEFNRIKQNKPHGKLGSKKELTDNQKTKNETGQQTTNNDDNGVGVKPHADIHDSIQRATDWKTARANFNSSLSTWKKTYGNKFLKNDQVEKYLEEKVEYDRKLNKREGTKDKIDEHTSAYKKIEFWAGPKGYVIGNLRLLLGEKFDVLAEKIEGLKERTHRARAKARLLKSPTFSKGWMAKIVQLLLKGFKIGFEEFLEYSFQVFAGCIAGVIEKFEEEMRQKLVEGLVDEELEKALEELKKELEALIAIIHEKYEEEIAAFEKLLDLMQDAAFYTSIITTAVNLIRVGVQVVSCFTPPLLGCLWGLVANIGIEVALNLVVGTQWFEENFMKPLVRDLMDGFLKRSLLKFLNAVFELVGLADYVVGVEACKPSEGEMKSLKHDTGSGIMIPPDMYREHARQWEEKYRSELLKDVVAASGGTATREDIEKFLEIVKKENMSSEEFNKIVSGSKTSEEGFDFKKISGQVPGLETAKEEGGEQVKVIDGEKSPMKGGLGGEKAGSVKVYNASINHTKGTDTTIILLCVSTAGENVLLTNVKAEVESRYYFDSKKGVRISGREGADSMQIVYKVTHAEGYTVTFSDSEGVVPLGKQLWGYVDL